MTTPNGVLEAVGSPAISLTDVAGLVGEALRGAPAGERRFLVLVPDSTRKAPVADVFRAIHDAVDGRADRVDAMIAQGTHGPMSDAEKRAWVFGGARYPRSTVFDHAWDDPDALTPLGVVPLDDQLDRFGENREFAPLLGFDRDMRIRVNAKLLEYDRLVLLTRVQPHEVAGFAGGAKQIFPGVSGPEMISLLHAIGSLRTNRGIHGVMPNPVRDLIDDMALNLPNPITTIGLVIDDDGDAIHGAFVQPDGWRECVERAAELSAAVNIRYVPRRVRRLIAALPRRKDGSWLYPDLWTGAKGVLKTEDAVADGGELVVWAPNIDSISDAHGDLISAIGYHTYAYFLSRPESWQTRRRHAAGPERQRPDEGRGPHGRRPRGASDRRAHRHGHSARRLRPHEHWLRGPGRRGRRNRRHARQRHHRRPPHRPRRRRRPLAISGHLEPAFFFKGINLGRSGLLL